MNSFMHLGPGLYTIAGFTIVDNAPVCLNITFPVRECLLDKGYTVFLIKDSKY